MLTLIDWPAFLIAMLIVELTPGPNMGWLATLSAKSGRRIGLAAVAGITLGLAIQLLAAMTGLSALMMASPWIYQSLRWAGVAFMLFLAWEAFSDTGSASTAQMSGPHGFRRGLIANLLNPKAFLFYLVIVAQFARPEAGSLTLQIAVLGGIHLIVAVLIHIGIVIIGDRLGAAFEKWRVSLAARTGFAAALVGIAIWIAISTRHAG